MRCEDLNTAKTAEEEAIHTNQAIEQIFNRLGKLERRLDALENGLRDVTPEKALEDWYRGRA